MMHRRHFPSPSEGHALGLWSLTLPQWATPPSSAGERSATRSLRARAVPATLLSETRVCRSTDVSPELIAAHDPTSCGEGASAQLSSRIRLRLHRRVLDREIAAGEPVHTDPVRALRASQLTGAPERLRVAVSLANIVEAADERHADPSSRVTLNHADVLAARHGIVALIEVLRSEQTVAARGVALARLLSEERSSPMLCESSGRTVQQAVSEALAAL
jgi:hypothetical protein